MAVYNGDTRVFYNKDCGKWGVEKITKGVVMHCRDGMTRQLYKWSQVVVGKNAYTPYYKVACRWSEQIKEGVMVHADMEEDYM